MNLSYFLPRFKQLFFACCLVAVPTLARTQSIPTFKVVPLGVWGGIDESNLSAYMVAAPADNNYVCLDAGTLRAGIDKAIAHQVFNIPAEQVLKRYIKGYFISHSHLDHLAGMLINAPEDSTKNIYALQSCIDVLKANYFTWKSWANFADQGEAPALAKYHYRVLEPGEVTPVENTALTVQAFPLSHSNLTSTAFLLNNHNSYLLYLGDTGADEIEKSENLKKLWTAVAPLVKNHQLKALMIEVSFPSEQPDKTLFGHLTPRLLMQELKILSSLCGPENLKGLNVIITHLKPPAANIALIKRELAAANNLGIKLIYPEQGKKLLF